MDFNDAYTTSLFQLIARATARVADEYFQLPIAGEGDPQYRERVYCYELYHQLRLAWPDELLGLTLCGEVDKRRHPVIQGPLLDLAKPDFLVHAPGGMDQNTLVIEVKPINGKLKHFKKDVRKVAAFLQPPAQYTTGVCLVYGREGDGSFDDLREAGHEILVGTEVVPRLHLFRHDAPGAEAFEVPWAGH
jgi:hypothetical protein